MHGCCVQQTRLGASEGRLHVFIRHLYLWHAPAIVGGLVFARRRRGLIFSIPCLT